MDRLPRGRIFDDHGLTVHRVASRSVSALRVLLVADLVFLLATAVWTLVGPRGSAGADTHMVRLSALAAWAILDVECGRLDHGALALRRILGVCLGLALFAAAAHWTESGFILAAGGLLCVASAALCAVVLHEMTPGRSLALLREVFDAPTELPATPPPAQKPLSHRPVATVPAAPNSRRRGVPLFFTVIGCLWVFGGAVEALRGPFFWWGLPLAAGGMWIVAIAPEFVPRLIRGAGRRRLLANAPPAGLILCITLLVLARATWLIVAGPLDASGPAAAIRKAIETPG